MDSTIIAAIIGGVFVVIAAIIGIQKYGKKNVVKGIKKNKDTEIKINQR